MNNKYIIIFFLLTWMGSLTAQPGKVKESWSELAEKADFLMEEKSYFTAAEYYADAIKLNSQNVDLKYNRAEALRLGRNYKRAATAYNSLRKRILRGKLDKNEYPLIQYHYGIMMKQAGDYEEAEEALYQFLQEFDAENVDASYKAKAKIAYEGCQMARKNIASIVKVNELDALGRKVNSKYTESSAFVMEDGTLLYSSIKENEPIILEGQTASSKLYTATVEEDYKVKKAEKFGMAIPDGLMHIGSAAIAPDGDRLYMTICGQEKGEVGNCAIYVSSKNPGNDKYDWGRPEKMPAIINAEEHQNITPFATKASDGRDVLYFSSNRPGGEGGMDIWVATGSDGNFTEVVNLGKSINTVGEEVSPFVDEAEGYEDPRPILYFSSDGHVSYGGLDIQVAYKNNVNFTEWSDVKNAGLDLNSTADEFSYVLSPDRTRAYFVSNREGGYSISSKTCCDDVFVANIAPPSLEKIIVADLGGKVFDENKKALEGVTVNLYDMTTGKSLLEGLSTGKAGFAKNPLDLERKYRMEVSVAGYDTQTYDFNTVGLEDNKSIYKDFYLKKTFIPVVSKTCQLTGKVYGDGGTANTSLLTSANVKIYQFINGKQELFKEITSDSRGAFVIDLPKENRYRIVVSKDGYLNTSSSVSTKRVNVDCSKSVTLTMKEKRQNVAFKIENILYDFNSAQLRDESIPNLEVLLKLLNDNPSIIIELGSHTDSKGTDEYNQKLSQDRAQSVVNWLISRGVTSSRLVAKGYGESVPLVSNTNPDGSDNPENRQLNRRTEFKIIGDVRN